MSSIFLHSHAHCKTVNLPCMLYSHIIRTCIQHTHISYRTYVLQMCMESHHHATRSINTHNTHMHTTYTHIVLNLRPADGHGDSSSCSGECRMFSSLHASTFRRSTSASLSRSSSSSFSFCSLYIYIYIYIYHYIYIYIYIVYVYMHTKAHCICVLMPSPRVCYSSNSFLC